MSIFCLLFSLALYPETMGPAPALAVIDDNTPTEVVAALSDPGFPSLALDEMRRTSERIDRLATAAESEVVAAARCESGAGCAARLDQAVTRLRCVGEAQRRAQSALENSERAVAAIAGAEHSGHPELALIRAVEREKVRIALDRSRQSATDVAVCVGSPAESITVSYR